MKRTTMITTAGDEPKRGCYVSWLLDPRCGERVHAWCRRMRVVEPLEPGEHHVTVMYSRDQGVDPRLHGDRPLPSPFADGCVVPDANRRIHVLGPAEKPGALVVHLDSAVLRARHAYWRDRHHLINSFPDYLPHMSLSYAFADQDPGALIRMAHAPLCMPLRFDREHVDHCK